MKKILILMIFVSAAVAAAAETLPAKRSAKNEPVKFDDYFYDRTLRFDYYHSGDSRTENYFFDCLKSEPFWAGSKVSLLDTTGFGNQYFRIVDTASGREIYSRGFCTLFNEWRATPEAEYMQRAYPEGVVFPCPKRECRIEIFARDKSGEFVEKFRQTIDPEDYTVEPFVRRYDTFDVSYNGIPEHCLDIVLIPEGYTESERAKFEQAAADFAREMFRYSPFRENRRRINIRAVWAPSADSGVTMPGEHIWRDTACGANFYTFGIERYQTIVDFQRVRDIAAHAPYDYIYVLSNTQKYGGGGIFNFYGISSANCQMSTGKVYVHEFGHLLMGLGDEYVDPVSFDSMYPHDIEPWEVNLTTLVDYDRKEIWKSLLSDGVPLPTPDTAEYEGKVGFFEGGGYQSKGIYRPWRNCMMNNLHTTESFCPVCTKAISEYMDFICK